MVTSRVRRCMLGGLMVVALCGSPALAGSHLWRINEVFSSADGTVQFVEMKECCGAANEIFINNKWVRSDATGNQWIFPGNLPAGSTANAYLLLATQSFADLPGAPTPDHIIPENFFDTSADTVRYWTYGNSPLTFAAGELPLDGVNSLHDAGLPANNTFVAVNSPTNFNGESGSVVVLPPCDGDINEDNTVNVQDLVDLITAWGTCPAPCAADIDGSGIVDVLDLIVLISNWGPCA